MSPACRGVSPLDSIKFTISGTPRWESVWISVSKSRVGLDFQRSAVRASSYALSLLSWKRLRAESLLARCHCLSLMLKKKKRLVCMVKAEVVAACRNPEPVSPDALPSSFVTGTWADYIICLVLHSQTVTTFE